MPPLAFRERCGYDGGAVKLLCQPERSGKKRQGVRSLFMTNILKMLWDYLKRANSIWKDKTQPIKGRSFDDKFESLTTMPVIAQLSSLMYWRKFYWLTLVRYH